MPSVVNSIPTGPCCSRARWSRRFFISYAQVWCQNASPAQSRLRALTDPHSPGDYRVNGVVSNMPEFQQTWGCKAGQRMVRENACRVW